MTVPLVLKVEHYDMLMQMKKDLQPIPGEIELAECIGVDCEEYKKMHDYSLAWIDVALEKYFPNGRPK